MALPEPEVTISCTCSDGNTSTLVITTRHLDLSPDEIPVRVAGALAGWYCELHPAERVADGVVISVRHPAGTKDIPITALEGIASTLCGQGGAVTGAM